jgi:hypothetical protein
VIEVTYKLLMLPTIKKHIQFSLRSLLKFDLLQLQTEERARLTRLAVSKGS